MNTSMTRVIILAGCSGSGKTTYAKKLLAETPGRICSADDYFTDPNTGIYTWDRRALGDAHAWCFSRFLHGLQAGARLLVVDNTNTSALDIAPYVLASAAYGVPWKLVQVGCDPAVAASRNVHGLTLSKVINQHDRMWAMSVPKSWWPNCAAVGDLNFVSNLCRRNAEQEKKNGNKGENEAA